MRRVSHTSVAAELAYRRHFFNTETKITAQWTNTIVLNTFTFFCHGTNTTLIVRLFPIGRGKKSQVRVGLKGLKTSVFNNHSHLSQARPPAHFVHRLFLRLSYLVCSLSLSSVRLMNLVCVWFRLILSRSLSTTNFCVSDVAEISGENRNEQLNNNMISVR